MAAVPHRRGRPPLRRARQARPPAHLLQRALDAVDSPFVLTDAQRRITWCNAGFTRLSGYSLAEARGRSPGELLQFEGTDPATVAAMRSALRAGLAFKGRVLNRARDGRAYWLSLDIEPLHDRHGRLEGFAAAQADITATVLNHEYLRSMVNSAAAGILVQDEQGTIVGCNPEAERLLGRPESDLLGLTEFEPPWQLCSREGTPLAASQHPSMRVLRSGCDVRGEVVGIVQPGGAVRWQQIDCRVVAGQAEGSRAVVVSFSDITALTTALADLAAERRRLRAALEGTQAGVWEWNLQTGEAWIDERWARLGGYEPAELEPVSIQTWIGMVHPDDLAHLQEQQRRHAAGELAFVDVACRMRHKQGHWLWVGVRGCIATRTAEGKPQWMYGTHVNIDEAKTGELALQHLNTKLQALFELSPVGIALNDVSDARFIEFNAALLTMTGYSREEMAALRHRDISPPEFAGTVARQRDLLLSAGRYGPYESELIHKDGRRIPVQLSGVRVALPDGSQRIWSIIQNIEPRKRMEHQLRSEARTDRLTGLPNRALLMERLQESVARAQAAAGHGFALLFIDFDRFKLVNDTLGHDTGDQLLRLIADRLREALRTGDTLGSAPNGHGGGNVVARFGGDEFVVLLNDVQGVGDVAGVAGRLLGIFAAPYWIASKEIHSSASIGIVLADAGCESAASVLRNADMAMYEAKRAGRSNYAFFDESMLTRVTRTVQIEEALRRAIQLDQLSVVYQPIVNLETGELASAEALLRWQHPELGAVPPAEFIPIAEDSGLIVAIGDWVLRQACMQWRRWRQQAPHQAPAAISVNLSRVQMSQGEALLQRVAQILAEAGMQPQQLQLEVTEREVMRDPAGARRLMDKLRAMGVKLAMDDFGTGTSSLGCLREYPFDTIKIDKSFIDDLSGSVDMLAVIHATVSVVENLGMVSVAEGIEQEAQVGMLQSLGCRYGQGFYFSRPVAGDRLLAAVQIREACG
jgi:diguanylate cyclase (GGDEF)-like protein/PAS domain S-box-containing protein